MSIPCFIPSKDRPAQLLLLLESLYKNAPGLFIPRVMYTYSNDEFKRGYEIVKEKLYKEFDYPMGQKYAPIWLDENQKRRYRDRDIIGGEEIFYTFLEENAEQDNIICLFSDDSILYRPFKITEKGIKHLFQFDDLWTFVLRLGQNIIVQDYVNNTSVTPPEELMWRWDERKFWDDAFGFATGFDGYFYKAKDLLELSERKPFGRICTWEHMICKQFLANPPKHRPMMACPKESKVFVEQVNTSHEFPHNTTHTFNVSLKQLNDQLLAGLKIDLESMDFSKVNCTHGEIPWSYKPL